MVNVFFHQQYHQFLPCDSYVALYLFKSFLLDPFVNRRTILLLMLVQAIDGFFVLEQPSSSLLPRHDRFQWLVYQWYKINLKVACLVLFWKPNLLTSLKHLFEKTNLKHLNSIHLLNWYFMPIVGHLHGNLRSTTRPSGWRLSGMRQPNGPLFSQTLLWSRHWTLGVSRGSNFSLMFLRPISMSHEMDESALKVMVTLKVPSTLVRYVSRILVLPLKKT